MSEGTPRVLILCGSPGDLDLALTSKEVLEDLGIDGEIRVLSAHRTPDETARCARGAEREGFSVVIAFAGLAAHLAGVVAAHTLLPVIGVPVGSGPLRGIDAALATLQMPPGTPVATVAIDGARNAALLAGRIVSVGYAGVRERLAEVAARDRERYSPDRVEAEIQKRMRARKQAGEDR